MALKTIKATIQVRRGAEQDFDPTQMSAGEWAVSTDTKHVWMCFGPGIVLRMATYDSFEADVQKIQAMLAECKGILDAVKAFEALAKQHKDNAAASAAQALAKAVEAAQSASDAAASLSAANASAAAALASQQAAEAAKTAAQISEVNAKGSADAAKASEAAAAQSATAAAGSAGDAADKADKAADSATAAAGAATEAGTKAGEASGFADLSKSYAVGTEGQVREGDVTDNSKYYSEQSKASADTSKTYLTKVEQAGDDAVDKINDALALVKPDFVVDIATGHLLYSGSYVDMMVENGHLKWGIVA